VGGEWRMVRVMRVRVMMLWRGKETGRRVMVACPLAATWPVPSGTWVLLFWSVWVKEGRCVTGDAGGLDAVKKNR